MDNIKKYSEEAEIFPILPHPPESVRKKKGGGEEITERKFKIRKKEKLVDVLVLLRQAEGL